MMAYANFLDERLPMRFWDKVIPEPNSGCWLWFGCTSDAGYGRCQGRKVVASPVLVHRYAYTELIGPIPPGLTIDHLCKTPCCVNPAHLEPVTQRENNRRADWRPGVKAATAALLAKTTCANGHELSGDNLQWENGKHRRCVICRRASRTASYHRNKGVAA